MGVRHGLRPPSSYAPFIFTAHDLAAVMNLAVSRLVGNLHIYNGVIKQCTISVVRINLYTTPVHDVSVSHTPAVRHSTRCRAE